YDGVVLVMNRQARELTEPAVFARSEGLQPEDEKVLLDRGRLVSAVAPVDFYEEIVARGGEQRKTRITGATLAYPYVRSGDMESGRFVNEADMRAFARVCVLGYRLKLRLFGSEDAVGQAVNVGSRRFTVVGVGKKLGNMFVNDSDFI